MAPDYAKHLKRYQGIALQRNLRIKLPRPYHKRKAPAAVALQGTVENIEMTNMDPMLKVSDPTATKLAAELANETQLPEQPVSPVMHGGDNPTDTEPFPEFVDPYPPIEEEPLHCVRHCTQRVCRKVAAWSGPSCPCNTEPTPQEPNEPSKDELEYLQPEIELGSQYSKLPSHNLEVDRDSGAEIVSIDSIDMKILLNLYITRAGATHFEELEDVVGERHGMRLTILYRDLIGLYIKRRAWSGQLELPASQLQLELTTYMILALRDWGINHPEDVDDRVIRSDWREYFEHVQGERPAAVAAFHEQCVEDILLLMMWWSRETKKFREEQEQERLARGWYMKAGAIAATVVGALALLSFW